MKKKIVISVLISFLFFGCGKEKEGVLGTDGDLDNCRGMITVGKFSWTRFVYDFTCLYDHTKKKDVIRGGLCVAIIPEDDGKGCSKAYVYSKDPSFHCPSGQSINNDGVCAQNEEENE